MSLTHKFFEDQKIMLTTWSGNVSDTELVRFYMGIFNNNHWSPEYSEIIDIREAELSQLSSEALEQLSELTANCMNGEDLKLAIIAPSTLDSNLARIYQAFSHIPNESTRVCHHMSEAIDWLS